MVEKQNVQGNLVHKTSTLIWRVFNILFSILILLFFYSCNPSTESLAELTNVKMNQAGTNPAPKTRLKIMSQGNLIGVGNTTLAIGTSLAIRAVLVTEEGSFVMEIPANWYTSGSLNSANLIITGEPGAFAVFTPTVDSTGTISASIDDLALIKKYNIATNTAATGTINASSAIIPDQIVMVAGNEQTGTAGTNLPTALKIKVLNAGNLPVNNAAVNFSVINGGGSVITAQPVYTDASGEAISIVQLGTVSGTSNNTFSATIGVGTITQVIFSESSIAGAPAKLAFRQHPAGVVTNSSFNTQPIVEVQDSYGNLVTTATNTVVMSVFAGSGILSGTVSVNAVNGLVNYVNLRYDVQENNVRLRASSAPLTAANSNLFNVGTILASAQCIANPNYLTTEGGCLDLISGLVWSSTSISTYTWHQVAWDSNYTDVPPENWEIDQNKTYDLSGYPHADTQDGSVAAYCHDLVESGYSDWRLPSLAEYQSLNVSSGGAIALQDAASSIWTGSRSGVNCTATANNKCRHNISTNVSLTVAASSVLKVKCVRKPRAVSMIFSTQPAAATKGFGVNVPFETQPVITFKDSQNITDTVATYPVTLTAVDGVGNLVGTLTKSAISGIATFTNIGHGSAETIRLKASSPGFSDVFSNNIVINQTYPWALCQASAAAIDFVNANGGCKEKGTGMIFSSASISNKSWYETIWDDVALSSNDEDVDDTDRTDDYSLIHPPLGITDISLTNYCHDLTESGLTDWKAPEYTVLSTLITKSPTTSVNFHTTNLWTSATLQATPANSYYYSTVNTMLNNTKTNAAIAKAICVRQDPPTQLIFTQQPAGGANGFGAGIVFATQPIVRLYDAQGVPLYGLSVPVTIKPYLSDGVTPATGNLWVGDENYGNEVTVTSVNSTATFSNLSYDKANETILLKASVDPISWKGASLIIPDVDSNSFAMPVHYLLSLCQAPNANWATQNGGCRDLQAGGIVWSHVIQTTKTWHQVVWDSLLPDSGLVDVYDGVLIDDYDATLPPGTGPDNDPENYCHTLRLNGFFDWRAANYNDMNVGLKTGARLGIDQLYKGAAAASYLWTGGTDQVTQANSLAFRVSTKTWHVAPHVKTSLLYPVCVRTP